MKTLGTPSPARLLCPHGVTPSPSRGSAFPGGIRRTRTPRTRPPSRGCRRCRRSCAGRACTRAGRDGARRRGGRAPGCVRTRCAAVEHERRCAGASTTPGTAAPAARRSRECSNRLPATGDRGACRSAWRGGPRRCGRAERQRGNDEIRRITKTRSCENTKRVLVSSRRTQPRRRSENFAPVVISWWFLARYRI